MYINSDIINLGDIMNNLSKSKYTLGKTCEKKLWLSCFKPEVGVEDDSRTLENGNLVGDLARHLFGDDYVLIDYNKGLKEMIRDTKIALAFKPNIICEASFSYNGNFCSVDILKNGIHGVELYEVKSTTDIKDIYIDDISYQMWVLKQCGLDVKKSFLVHINSDYIKNGELDLNKFFKIEDATAELRIDEVEELANEYHKVINKNIEPIIDLNDSCRLNSEYCPFFKYCTRDLPKPNVFDLASTQFRKKLQLYNKGIISFNELLEDNSVNDKAIEQINYELNDLNPKINMDGIKSFMDKVSYPLYFLDFESYQEVIPKFDGTKPYQQICFQYSLDYYLEEGGELYHKEFLNDKYDENPMLSLCEHLVEDIPLNSCVVVYNESFEKSRLQEMANIFPQYKDHLLNIRDGIIDLMVVFRNHDYYIREMKGSYSIKYVLPALFPDDDGLNYQKLDQVHKGDEASEAYLSLSKLCKQDETELRKNMLKYCALDTYAMVKIYDKLKMLV